MKTGLPTWLVKKQQNMEEKIFDGHFLSAGLLFSQKIEADLVGEQIIIGSM